MTTTTTAEAPSTSVSAAAGSAARTNCPLCGSELDSATPDECPRCDWVTGYRRRHSAGQNSSSSRDKATALMSVVPGLGHLYKGHTKIGAVLMALTPLVIFFSLATASATAGVALVLIPIYWSAVMLHAFWAEDLALKKARAASNTAASARGASIPA